MASKCESASHLQSNKESSDFLTLEMSHKLLKPLDEALRCRICFEYFNNCMITKCSHNYCSVCIRRYMLYKAQCPVCFQDASEPELRNNRLIDEVLRTYIKIKEMLRDVVQPQSKAQSVPSKPVETVNVQIEKELPKSDECQDSLDKTVEFHIDEKEVPCPVCYKIVLKDRINIHLDTCLKIKEREQYSERKTLPKLVYHLLSDKDIRKKLKEHYLNATGDRQTLIRRHKNFLTLYNANCDSLNPKPVIELVQEVEKQEIEERLNSFKKPIQVHKRSEISEIEREHELYAKQHQSHFNALIEDLHQRNIGKIKVKEEIEEDCTESCDARTGLSTCHAQGTFKSNIVDDKMKSTSGKLVDDIAIGKDVKQEHSSFNIVETRSLSKSDETIQDLITCKNFPTLDDFETEEN